MDEAALPTMLEVAAQLQVLPLHEAVLEAVKLRLVAENALTFWAIGDRPTIPGLALAATRSQSGALRPWPSP